MVRTPLAPTVPVTPATWVKVVGLNPIQKPGSQGGIHASIRPDPVNPAIVYVGGDKKGWIWIFPLAHDRLTVGMVTHNAYIKREKAKFRFDRRFFVLRRD